MWNNVCSKVTEEPAKIHLYRDVFNHENNIDFVKPKKDRCDILHVKQKECDRPPLWNNNFILLNTDAGKQKHTMREIKTEVAVVSVAVASSSMP